LAGAYLDGHFVLGDEDAVCVAAVDDDVPPGLEHVGHAAAIDDRHGVRAADVTDPEVKPVLRVPVAAGVTNHPANERNGLRVTRELARLQLCLAPARDRHVQQEHREHGCDRQRDDEPDGTRVPRHD
jgi:hypothetical protein